ncbi:branched-chain amino acid transport system substrate-binding protein [Paucimonas lemoignei]|uniref:Branched-chain amino acid transport system substrate-binding protein n=1 Tax=Paucimonas lemoignei TaxID=29443 RepID=A0A4V2UIX8_PAULE|nr:ABC transporter substrate-binding protein [Paucimonas lemoignei]TCS37850.1 branched-chain amino acid transport system substrate-binding protein [Paucimonas lemoignei]
MQFKRKAVASAVAVSMAMGISAPASAQISDDTIKIGMLTDMSGVYSDISGQGGIEALKMAIADMGGSINGKKIELVYADHLHKADIASSKAREWADRDGVDLLMAGANSAVMLAMGKIANEKKKVFMIPATGTGRITNEDCNPYMIHYGYDTVAAARGTSSAVVNQGGKSWYYLTADYVFGHSLEGDSAKVVKANGGTVLGAARHPLNASDFSSFLMMAQASKAQVLGFANASNDLVASIKAANEFGVNRSMKMAVLLMFITDVHALGLQQTQGLYSTAGWYWDQSPESRTWSKRYFAVMKRMPTALHASTYSAAMTYLKAVKALGTDDSDKVMAYLKKNPVNDMYTSNAKIREDGRLMSDLKLIQVKKPEESKAPWDYYKIVQNIKAEDAFTTKAESKCSLLK